jgi:3-isopropylmalate dehydrogenase
MANPLATILSLAMMLRYTFNQETLAQRIESAVKKVLKQNYRTADIYEPGMTQVGTIQMGDAVLKNL